MTLRLETPARARSVSAPSSLVIGLRGALGGLLLAALACQEPAAAEPPLERPSSPEASAAAPAAPAGGTELAKYSPAAKAASPAAGESPAAQPTGGTGQGPVVSEESFSAWLQAPAPLVAGTPGKVEAVLVAKPPYHCNAEYPHKFKLAAPPAGLSYPEATVKGMQVGAERSVLSIPIVPQKAGPAQVKGTLMFSVCTDERCLVEKRELSLDVDVE